LLIEDALDHAQSVVEPSAPHLVAGGKSKMVLAPSRDHRSSMSGGSTVHFIVTIGVLLWLHHMKTER